MTHTTPPLGRLLTPPPTRRRLLGRIAAAAVAMTMTMTVALVAGSSGPASAGGWAVASLDAIPTAAPGATVDVSFSILQHGVRPVDIDEGVGIEILDADGTVAFFPAVGDGVLGHYVATVTFPDAAGSYQWTVRMGGFGPYELGTLELGEAASGALWSTARWFALAGALLLAGVAVVDLARARRRNLAFG